MAYLRFLNFICDGITAQGLRIDFDIIKSTRGKTKENNGGIVKVYNMAPATRKKMSKIGSTVMINAGHLDSVPSPIFLGTLKNYNEINNDLEIISEFEIEDDGGGIDEIRTPLIFAPGFTASNIIAAVGALANTPLVTPVTKDFVYWRGWSFIGPIKKALDNVVNDTLKLEWFIDKLKLYVVDPDQPIVSAPLLLSPATGLIGSPEEITEKDDKGNEIKSYKFKSVLMPRATVGQLVTLTSKFVNGSFKIDSLRQYGSTFGNDFYNEYTAKKGLING